MNYEEKTNDNTITINKDANFDTFVVDFDLPTF